MVPQGVGGSSRKKQVLFRIRLWLTITMSKILPADMASYATYELVERLAVLTTQQRAAIARIVEYVYIQNKPLADLLRGEGKICSERRYYTKDGGWHHDPEFQAALKESARLALQARTREELTALANAKRKARLNSDDIVDQLLNVARYGEKGSERVAASKVLLDYAEPDPATAQPADDAAADWWEAADEHE